MLLTDIEGSTRAVRALGADRWETVRERHTRIIRDALAAVGARRVTDSREATYPTWHVVVVVAGQ